MRYGVSGGMLSGKASHLMFQIPYVDIFWRGRLFFENILKKTELRNRGGYADLQQNSKTGSKCCLLFNTILSGHTCNTMEALFVWK
ncbi:hypothetical protein O6H91_15G026500 [Diphasiastrum complanatum]|uniref:Uncharacterized protein n=1 Tax=Diphasiastrum complanatum TaxID=34168 RepID=A0ACC2BGX8_DIPCM|nr:hypothetical protein O6H91_15G026500 [Diphasiastrum complanatum]